MTSLLRRAVVVLAPLASMQAHSQSSLTPRDIASLARNSVVTVTAIIDGEEYGYGSGFLLQPNGIFVTNLHVVMGADSLRIDLEDGQSFDAIGVLNYDEERDIVVLKAEAEDLPALAVGDDRSMQVGDPVYVMGNPLGLSGTFSDGLLSAKRTEDGTDHLQITAPISEGSSGGPVLNEFGEAVGIATSFYVDGQNLNMAMPARYAQAMALEAGAPVPFADSPVVDLGKTGFGKLGDFVWEWPEIMDTLPAAVRNDLADLEAWEQQVAARSRIASDAMQAEGWQPWGEIDWSYIGSGDWGTLTTFLPPGNYTVYSICDDDCTDVDLAVFDPDGTMLVEDTEIDAFPVIEFAVSQAGNYSIDTAMYACETSSCLYRTTLWAEQGMGVDEASYPADVRIALAVVDQQIDGREDLKWLRRVEQDFPVVLQQFVALIAESVERDAPQDEIVSGIFSWSSSIGSAYLPTYLAQASDDAVIEFSEYFLATLENLMQRKGEACYAWMFGNFARASGADWLREFDGEAMNRIISRVIESVGTGFVEPISDDAALAYLDIVFADMEEQYDSGIVDDMALLDSRDLSSREQRRVCEISEALYATALDLPGTVRANVLRYLFAAE